MAARKMMAAKGEGVYWQKTGDAECLERLPVDWVVQFQYGRGQSNAGVRNLVMAGVVLPRAQALVYLQ